MPSISTSNHNGKREIYMDKKVVYSSIFTSNHNTQLQRITLPIVVYSSIFTSNHNTDELDAKAADVVYSSIFTSNHNVNIEIYSLPMNYISILFYEVAFMAFLRGKYTKKILIVSVL